MLHFHLADASDALLISRIHAASWRTAYKGLVPQHFLDRLNDEYWVPSVRVWLDSGRFSCLLLYDDAAPLGVCIFGRCRDEALPDTGEIVSLYMLPACIRKGYGGQLLEEAIALMRQDGYTSFCLWTLEGNEPAAAFYQKHGFMPADQTNRFPLGGATITERLYIRRT